MEEVQRAPAPSRTNHSEGATPGPYKPSWWQRTPVILLGMVALAGLLVYGLGYLAESFTHESTDDAFLDADIVAMAPKVAGRVKKVYVTANQAVKAGDLLLEIDPADLQIQLDQKRAAVAA
ncbi:MAG TPA: biotin/lipoyl-binding protein, partial [Bacillota bacterium]|nr:biotin/lipoyl-binding protein [Bacillota bacterium]